MTCLSFTKATASDSGSVVSRDGGAACAVARLLCADARLVSVSVSSIENAKSFFTNKPLLSERSIACRMPSLYATLALEVNLPLQFGNSLRKLTILNFLIFVRNRERFFVHLRRKFAQFGNEAKGFSSGGVRGL